LVQPEGVFHGQLVQPEVLGHGSELLRRRTMEPDPGQGAVGVARGTELRQLDRCGSTPTVLVDRAIDDHRVKL
jgi:hypothetical protein